MLRTKVGAEQNAFPELHPENPHDMSVGRGFDSPHLHHSGCESHVVSHVLDRHYAGGPSTLRGGNGVSEYRVTDPYTGQVVKEFPRAQRKWP